MANIKFEVSENNKVFLNILKAIPDVSGGFLAYVGGKARNLLKELFLSGQDIDLRAFPKDKVGRYTITSNVSRNRQQTTIKSYPLNLFEMGRTLRNNEREVGKFTLTVKLKEALMSRMPQYINDYENNVATEILKDNEL